MSSADWPRVARLFDELSELAPGQRGDRLRSVREEEGVELAAELERLLVADAGPGGALDGDLGAALPARAGEPRGDAEDLSGRLAGAYRLVERIGSGGMGTVYAAVRADGLYEQRVAVKVLTVMGSMGSPELLRRFARERAILAGLEHPHIARLLDAGALDERPYLVMELVEGESLVAHCDRQRADVASRLRLFLQVCAAVAFAHRRLVVHRDLKPANVLVNAGGEVKLLDFGIASLLDAERTGETAVASVTTIHRAFTPAYAAPEQIFGQPVTTATDVYALGALLHELLVGRPPESAWLERRVLDRELRGDLEAIVATALRREPEQRYGSAEALAADVERHLAGLPVAARGQDRAYRARLFARRHRGSLAASAVAVLGLVAGLWLALQQAREARSEALRASAMRRFLVLELKRELLEEVPMGTDGPTLGYMLDHGLRAVDQNLAKEPEAAAEIFSIAGETFRMISAHDRAAAAFRGALARKSALYAADDLRLRRARFDLAHALLEAGDVGEAGSLLEALERESLGQVDVERFDFLRVLGEQRRQAGNLDGAETANTEALALLVRLGRQRSGTGLDQLHRLATVLYLAGKYRQSERLLGEAATLAEAMSSSHAPIFWLRRAFARHRTGDLEGAQEAYRRVRELFALEPAGPASVWALGYVSCGEGLLSAERGDAEAARDLLTAPEVVASGADHAWTRGFGDPGIPCPALAAWARDDLAAVEQALAASAAASRPAARPDRDLLLAEMLLERGRGAEALALCDAAVRARDASSELQAWRRAEAHLLRGLALHQVGRQAEGLREVTLHAGVLDASVPRHRFLQLTFEKKKGGPEGPPRLSQRR